MKVSQTITVWKYKILFDPELGMYFLSIEEPLVKGGVSLAGKQYKIDGEIGGNHHPIIITFYARLWRKDWITASVENEQTCTLQDRRPEDYELERLATERMMAFQETTIGHAR